MTLEIQLEQLKSEMVPLERFLHLIASLVDKPKMRRERQFAGFRFDTANISHYCLLKAVRALSAFNASIELARWGFTQEICVLMRTVVECASHVNFVLSTNAKAEEIEAFISDYFADAERGNYQFRKPVLRQGAVHDVVGAELDEFVSYSTDAAKYERVKASKLYSNVYLALSNYVHCRYPETMDLYGGVPEKFHLRGMKGTPKDFENLQILETYLTTVSQSLQLMALKLGYIEEIRKDPVLLRWLQSTP